MEEQYRSIISNLHKVGVTTGLESIVNEGSSKSYEIDRKVLQKLISYENRSSKCNFRLDHGNIQQLTNKIRSAIDSGRTNNNSKYNPVVKSNSKSITLNNDAVRALYQVSLTYQK